MIPRSTAATVAYFDRVVSNLLLQQFVEHKNCNTNPLSIFVDPQEGVWCRVHRIQNAMIFLRCCDDVAVVVCCRLDDGEAEWRRQPRSWHSMPQRDGPPLTRTRIGRGTGPLGNLLMKIDADNSVGHGVVSEDNARSSNFCCFCGLGGCVGHRHSSNRVRSSSTDCH